MEQVVKKVEDVLNTLKCNLKFVKELLPNGEVYFKCYGSQKLRVYGLEMEAGILYYCGRNKFGHAYVDKWNTERTNGKELDRMEEIQLLKEKSGLPDKDVEKLYNWIIQIISMEEERLYDLVEEEFETRLPDIEIVDRCYGFMMSA